MSSEVLSPTTPRVVGTHCQVHENHIAKLILVHEPDMPSFMGALHPDGSLYENPVDLKKAQQEHKNLVSILEKNGVKTVKVRDVLKMDCEENLRERLKLERLAMKNLTYKLDNRDGDQSALLSEHDRYLMSDVYKEKIISEMSIDQIADIVLTNPTISLRKADLNTALSSTSVAFSPLSNLVFCRDQQITTPRGVVIGQLNSTTRAPEREVTKFCFEKLGMPVIGEIPQGGALEGGDFFPIGNDLCMIGLGLRTNWKAIHHCFDNDLFGTTHVAVVKDCFDWAQERMHLDTIWNIVHDTACAMLDVVIGGDSDRRRLVDLYKKDENGKYVLEVNDVEFYEFLKLIGYHVIPLSERDQANYGINFLNIGNGHLICPDMEAARKIARDENGTGKIEVIDYSHVSRMYGSIHCSTQVIHRENEKNGEAAGRLVVPHMRKLWTTREGRLQTSDTILMCPPTGFFFNTQAAEDNSFMNKPKMTKSQIQRAAMREYSVFHRMLTQDLGINVHTAINERMDCPDAVFLNNWFSTHDDAEGPTLVLYPMKYENRSRERIPETIARLKNRFKRVIDLSGYEKAETPLALEGTGAMVLDRVNRVAYMCQSQRADLPVVNEWCQKMGYELIDMGEAKDHSGEAVYHTNVVMGIGSTVAVVCLDAIHEEEKKKKFVEKLGATHTIIDITKDQMHHFCGNVIELFSPKLNGPVLIMSETAHRAFTEEQKQVLIDHKVAIGKAHIPTIETYGGGGVRCCIAELF
ncbi:hypothetical protein PROFUN_04121 [Planoprotostelium fungivorum]|uniref:Arginine deiminase n=1 Tax=Planoprotostelium fungivorum TaxID=1890364 RepID=A0A2P6N215_9EUKA|nr:hypothetical protein PROFUN_14085 [Planoprotostelium fungivorum]PRP84130.1 hypothetical protein PROFUN_04121 [Planoprotostelium fungivorum]